MVVVVLGVLGMHALLGAPAAPGPGVPAASEMTASEMTASVSVGQDHAADTTRAEPAALHRACSGRTGGHVPAGGHSMLSTCLARLGALTGGVLVAVPACRPTLVDRPAGVRSVGSRSWMGPPPPWTVLSLHQLSLLRV